MSILFESGPIRTQVCLHMERAGKQTNKQIVCKGLKSFIQHYTLKLCVWVRASFNITTCSQIVCNMSLTLSIQSMANKSYLQHEACHTYYQVKLITAFLVFANTSDRPSIFASPIKINMDWSSAPVFTGFFYASFYEHHSHSKIGHWGLVQQTIQFNTSSSFISWILK